MAKPIRTSDFDGHCGRPPALPDCSLIMKERQKNGAPVTIIRMHHGARKRLWPTTSIQFRTRFGIRLFTMSMRMCSLARRVHGEHSKNTIPNSTHCSSSQAFEEVSKSLRTVALTAETITAARMSQASRLPIQVVMASMARETGNRPLSHASRTLTFEFPLWRAGSAHRPFLLLFYAPHTHADHRSTCLLSRWKCRPSMVKMAASGRAKGTFG